MLSKINMNPSKQRLIVYIVLTVVTLAVYWQVHQYDFVIIDDQYYVTGNSYVQSGITLDGILAAFSIKPYGWDPLTFISLMFDNELYGLNAGGYHVTNVILHVLSTLLLFWLFNRMTGSVWRSTFVAGLFALHPLHVESVAWIGERKDVLSGFFWMLTLCFYVYYTGKPVIRRYLVVLFCYVCALMSKPMVLTLPIILIFLDYWPLGRLQSDNHPLSKTKIAGIIPLWQVMEKTPFIVLSSIIALITLSLQNHAYAQYLENFPLSLRLANAPVSFVTYLGKTFWPHDLSVLYPFSDQIPIWQVWGAILLIFVISAAIIAAAKHLPYLFVGWVWYSITVLPVIGIIQVGNEAMADRYTYLPSIGIYIMLAWGIPLLFQQEDMHKKIFFPAGMVVLTILAFLSWNQCGYWKNSFTLFSHALRVTKNNYLASNCLGIVKFIEGKNQEAIDYYTETIRLKPHFTGGYIGRGLTYCKIGQNQLAINDYNEAIRLDKNYADAYHERGIAYNNLSQYEHAIKNYNKAISLRPYFFEAYSSRGITYYKLGQYELAINDFNKAIQIEPNFAEAINNRGFAYFKQNNNKLGLKDAQRACKLGTCLALEWAKGHGLYR
jgi:protein O-mannosyl-transferase